MDCCMVITTCPDSASAANLAEALVKKKLAACAQLSPITSIYFWENQCHTDPEVRVVIKTRESLYPAVEKFILENHGYELPQIVQVPMTGGLEGYLDWIRENTRD